MGDPDRWGAWMAAAQDGDRDAYRLLLQAVTPWIVAYLRPVCGQEAEDVAQDALLSLHQARASYDPDRPFRAWAAAIARRRAVDWLRRKGRRGTEIELSLELSETLADPATKSEIEADDLRAERRAAVARALADLPASQRRAVELTKLEGRSVKDAAALTGQSESALKVATHRAIKTLKAALGRAGGAHGAD